LETETQLGAAVGGVGGGQDCERLLVGGGVFGGGSRERVCEEEVFEVAGEVHGFGAEGGHGCLLEDGEGGEDGGEVEGGGVGDLIACCAVDGDEVWGVCHVSV